MGAPLIKTRTVLKQSGVGKAYDAATGDAVPAAFFKPDDEGRVTSLIVDGYVFDGMGKPETITVTIEPGDKLNDNSDDDLRTAIFEALGAASSCWENLAGAGIFDSTRCKEIGEQLLERLGIAPA